MYYYVDSNNQQQGPVALGQLSQMGVTPETLVWKAGMEQWQKAKDVPEVMAALSQPQQPQPQQPFQPQQHYQPSPQKRPDNPFISPMDNSEKGFFEKNMKWIIPAAVITFVAVIGGAALLFSGGSASKYYGLWHVTDSMAGGFLQEKYIEFGKDNKYTETIIVKDAGKEVFHATANGEYKLKKDEDADGETIKVIDIDMHLSPSDITFSDNDDLQQTIMDYYKLGDKTDMEEQPSPYRMSSPEVEDEELTFDIAIADTTGTTQTPKTLRAEKVDEIPIHEHPGMTLYKEILASRKKMPQKISDGIYATEIKNLKDFVVIKYEYDEANGTAVNPYYAQNIRMEHIKNFGKDAQDIAALVADAGKGLSLIHVGKRTGKTVKIDFPYSELKLYVKKK